MPLGEEPALPLGEEPALPQDGSRPFLSPLLAKRSLPQVGELSPISQGRGLHLLPPAGGFPPPLPQGGRPPPLPYNGGPAFLATMFGTLPLIHNTGAPVATRCGTTRLASRRWSPLPLPQGGWCPRVPQGVDSTFSPLGRGLSPSNQGGRPIERFASRPALRRRQQPWQLPKLRHYITFWGIEKRCTED